MKEASRVKISVLDASAEEIGATVIGGAGVAAAAELTRQSVKSATLVPTKDKLLSFFARTPTYSFFGEYCRTSYLCERLTNVAFSSTKIHEKQTKKEKKYAIVRCTLTNTASTRTKNCH